MSIFDKLKGKNKIKEKNIFQVSLSEENNSVEIIDNYMLSELKEENLSQKTYRISLSELSKVNPIAIATVNNIKKIVEKNSKVTKNLYKVMNLSKNDTLKQIKGKNAYWGAIRRGNGTSTMAKLKKVNPNSVMALDPTIMMMSVALAGIESELGEIKELNKKVLSFLTHEKESEIESDLEILYRSFSDFKYNLEDKKYIENNHKQVLDIKRTANKNMIFYKKEIADELSKNKFFTTNNSMSSIINEIENYFKYYRASLYIYSFATLIEIFLLNNYKSDYLLSKKTELDALENEYLNEFSNAYDYIRKNADKSLEGNVLSGLGSAGKTIGNLAEKVKIKKVDNWLNEKGDNLKKSGEDIKTGMTTKFDDMKETSIKIFINQIEKIDCIYNQTKEIYFDNNNIYIEME